MMFGALFLWAALIGLAVWGASRLFPSLGQGNQPDHTATPLEILARRYARGELSREEFEAIKEDILRNEGDDER